MAFSISEGRITELYRPMAGGGFAPVRFSDSHAETYAQIWKAQPAVRTVVGFLARNIAQLGLHVYKRVSDVDRERVTDHPLAELLARPNPKTTPYRFVEAREKQLELLFDGASVALPMGGALYGAGKLTQAVVSHIPMPPECGSRTARRKRGRIRRGR